MIFNILAVLAFVVSLWAAWGVYENTKTLAKILVMIDVLNKTRLKNMDIYERTS